MAVTNLNNLSANFDYTSKIIYEQKQNYKTLADKSNLSSETLSSTVYTTEGNTAISSKIIKNPDVNFDSTIDIRDIANSGMLYNVKNTSNTYSSKYDLNDDGIIDIYDLTLMSSHMGNSIIVPDLNMETYVGDTFMMPSYLEASISDGYLTSIRSSWTSTPINTLSVASFNISGNLTDYNKSVTAQVKVSSRNENFNSINNGLTAIYNNKVYYSNPANNFYLSRSNLDGSYVVKICNDSAFYINVVSDWIYYVNASDNNSIYKIKIDGTGRTKISSDIAEFMSVSDGWIYYSNGSDYNTIYKVKIDGSQRTKLNDLTSLYVYLYNDEIYFCDYSTYYGGTVYGNLCSIKKDGSGYQDITYTKMGPNVRIGNVIYFLDNSGSLNYTKLDDKADSWSINGASGVYTSINTDGKYLYVSSENSIYKYDPSVYTFPDSQVSTSGAMININGNNLFAYSEESGTMMQLSLQTLSPKIFGVDNIIKRLSPITEEKVYQYDKYIYPRYVNAERLDGSIFPTGVTCDNKNIDTTKLGSYSLTGTVEGFNSKAEITVNVVGRGNSNQNLYQNGKFAQSGVWTYYTSLYDNKLYKINKDGGNRIKLSDDNASSINVIGDYVYYINQGDDYIYKVKSDGTSRTKIYPQSHYNKMITDGNKIYLQKYDGIYTIDMNGSNPQKIINANNNSIIDDSLALIGNYIIYSDKGIFAASLDGTFKKCLLELDSNVNFLTDGRYLFFEGPNVIRRLDLDTGAVKDLNLSTNSTVLNTIYNDKLYYSKEDGTYECDIDGLNSKRILDTKTFIMYCTQNGLYIEDSEVKKYYTCGYDGEYYKEFGGETQLKLIVPQSVIVTQGSTYSLPKTIMLNMLDDSVKEVTVSWNNNIVNTSVLGTYSYEGTVNGYSDKVSLDLVVTSSEVYGNTSSNKSNGCLVAKYDDWIIYSNQSDEAALYKMKSDGTTKTKLSSNRSGNIYIYGDWIYYTSTPADWSTFAGTLRRIKIDGTCDSVVATGTVVTFKNGWIYCQKYNELYKVRLDGCERTTVANNVNRAITDESAIYYQSSQDNKYYKVNFDGSNNILVNALQGYNYNFYGDYIYFTSYYNSSTYNGHATLRMKKDGTELTKIIETGADTLIINKNYIFRISSGGGLYRCNLDGTNIIEISSFYANPINIIDGWIYYNIDTENYRISLDGTIQETF
jgi:hypothetical protein